MSGFSRTRVKSCLNSSILNSCTVVTSCMAAHFVFRLFVYLFIFFCVMLSSSDAGIAV